MPPRGRAEGRLVIRIVVALLASASALATAAPLCGSDLRGTQTLESAAYVIAYRWRPAKIEVGKPFSLDIVTCPKGSAPTPAGLAVDAFMPEHGHGMNYKASVKTPAVGKPARFLAEGLMFHMPGRWDLYFDVQSSAGTERLTRRIVLE